MKPSIQMLSSERMDWRTPASLLERVSRIAPIGFDPCASEVEDGTLRLTECGLSRTWRGRGLVFCNPPYGRALADWAAKIAAESRKGAEIVALVPSRTDTRWWHDSLWPAAAAVCFWRGRITFEGAASGAPFSSALFYFGARPDAFGNAMRDAGIVVKP